MTQGDIVLIPFPFTDLTNSKVRPALVISNPAFNQSKNFIVMCISTKPGRKEFSLPLTQSDLDDGELKKVSYLRTQNVFTFEKRLAIKKVGELKKIKLKTVTKQYQSYVN